MEFLNQLLEKILRLLPTIYIVTTYEAGVRFTLGKHAKPIGPGWYLIWPMIHRFLWMETQTQVADLRNQSIRTKDGQELIVSGAIQYKIGDIEKAIVNVQDIDKSISTLALGIIADYISSKTLEECKYETLRTEILKGIREEARGWGLRIEKVFITDFGKTFNLRLLTNDKGE